MDLAIPPECMALKIVRRMSPRSGEQVADAVGLNRKQLTLYETFRVPPPDLLEALLREMDIERALYEAVLTAVYRYRDLAERAVVPATPIDPTPEEWCEIQAPALLIGRQAEQRALERMAEAVRARKAAEARIQAEALCARLENEPAPWTVVEVVREVQTWAVAERLAHRSAEAALDCVDYAMELAALAYRVAELVPCEPAFRQSLLGYTLSHGENALRAAADLAGAGTLFLAAEAHWKSTTADPGPLGEWRLQNLAGSLHRDQQRLDDSLAQIDASLAKAPARDKGRLLVSKALTLDRMGETEQALGLLAEAAQLAERQRNPRLRFTALFNRSAFLSRIGRYGEAELLLRELTRLADSLGRGLHQSRLRWLRGSIDAGLGRWETAESDLQAARRELANRNKVLESALVSLELLVLLCRRERSREIRKLVSWLVPLTRHEKLSLDARAALRQVCAADEGSGVTLELAEQALHLLARAPKADLPSVALTGGGCDGAMAATARIEDTAAVSRPVGHRRVEEIAGCGPDAGHPVDQLAHEAGGLPGTGPAGRQDWRAAARSTTRPRQAARERRAMTLRNMNGLLPEANPGAASPGRTDRPVQRIQVPRAGSLRVRRFPTRISPSSCASSWRCRA